MSGILVQKQAVKPIVRKIFKMFIPIFLATGFWRTDFEHVRESMEAIFSRSCQKTKLVFSRICYLHLQVKPFSKRSANWSMVSTNQNKAQMA